MKSRAFTLIELLVVVLIIGILSAIALPQYQKAVMKTRYATLKNLVESIAQAQQIYYLANNTYSNDFEELDVSMPGGYDTTQSEPAKYVYDWGKCQTYSNSKSQQIVSCDSSKISMRYQVNLVSGIRACWVLGSKKVEDYPLQNEVCKNETGLTEKSGASTGLDGTDYVRWSY